MRVGGLARGPCPPHPPGLGSPIPDGSLAAPAPCPAAAASRAAVPAPPSGSISAGQTGERPGSWKPGAQWPDRFAHLVPAPSQQACPVPVPCAQLSRTGGCRRPPTPPRYPSKGWRWQATLLPRAGPTRGSAGLGTYAVGGREARIRIWSPGPEKMQPQIQVPAPPGPSRVSSGR